MHSTIFLNDLYQENPSECPIRGVTQGRPWDSRPSMGIQGWTQVHLSCCSSSPGIGGPNKQCCFAKSLTQFRLLCSPCSVPSPVCVSSCLSLSRHCAPQPQCRHCTLVGRVTQGHAGSCGYLDFPALSACLQEGWEARCLLCGFPWEKRGCPQRTCTSTQPNHILTAWNVIPGPCAIFALLTKVGLQNNILQCILPLTITKRQNALSTEPRSIPGSTAMTTGVSKQKAELASYQGAGPRR